ncbi:tRNA-specific adenosine deaminase [Cardinium endosymbiont cEper1 of Encarsia pergandiella]|uniref:nucleoside deaminase n=1 Tax=Cardinium endosymbiont of Encarsia pergandiella TaxID=249402 RepID=UPI00027EA28A|nr:nucleoside deaminase [Cardinium endosymbiont of Encarsia pergandiella]CCM10188.1 tRNA-specific adenosine deaminase [Cardinium endosymbiont cEper1 of Encarsia pergandiella]
MAPIHEDAFFMEAALQEATHAATIGEVPVGAVIVAEHQIIARAHNQVEQLKDPTAHAELLAITAAAHYFNSKYLPSCTLYVTLEPCIMCGGALYWSQIKRLVFGASDPKRGYQSCSAPILHPQTTIHRNILAEASKELLICFFKKLRNTIL